MNTDTQLLLRYEELSTPAQRVAEALALFFGPAHSGDINKVLRLVGADQDEGIRTTRGCVKDGLHELEDSGLLERTTKGNQFVLPEPVLKIAIDRAVAADWPRMLLLHDAMSLEVEDSFDVLGGWDQRMSLIAVAGGGELFDEWLDRYHVSWHSKWAGLPALDPVVLRQPYLQGFTDVAVMLFLLPNAWNCLYEFQPVRELLSFLKKLPKDLYPRTWQYLPPLLAEACVLMGTPDKATAFDGSYGMQGVVAAVHGDFAKAEELFREETRELTGSTNRHSVALPGLVSLFAGIAPLRLERKADWRVARTRMNAASGGTDRLAAVHQVLRDLAESFLNPEMNVRIPTLQSWGFLETDSLDDEFIGEGTPVGLDAVGVERFAPPPSLRRDPCLEMLFLLLVQTWTHSDWNQNGRVRPYLAQLRADGYLWAAAQFEALIDGEPAWLQENGLVNLASLWEPEPEWRLRLQMLAQVAPVESAADTAEKPKASRSRLCWLVECNRDWSGHLEFSLTPIEQRPKKRGSGYTKGKKVALRRFHGGFDFNGEATDQDRAIAACVQKPEGILRYHFSSEYIFMPAAWKELVGHPRVFLGNLDSPLEIVAEEPQLRLQKRAGEYVLSFTGVIPQQAGVHCEIDGFDRLAVSKITEDHVRIAAAVGLELCIPATAEDDVAAVVAALSSRITVQSDLELTLQDVETVPADGRLHVRLIPLGEDGLQALVLACPLGDGGPATVPGQGAQHVVAQIDSRRLSATRDLEAEEDRVCRLFDACETLALAEEYGRQCCLDNPETALQALLELQAVEDQELVIEWPEGEKLKLRRQLDNQDLGLKVSSGRDWFALDGEVRVDDELVLSLRQLLQLMKDRNGSFVKLEDGSFLALTQHFQKLLDSLAHVCSEHRQELQIHPLAAPIVEELADDAKLESCDEWRERLAAFREAEATPVEIPATLDAELRAYQEDGVKWLQRLANCRVGACLADDMGLGKTVQALAAIVDSAPRGPSLVVAPASVIQNWASEAARFAPTLRPTFLHEGDREATVDGLGPFDLLIATYGIMQNEIERLNEVPFETIVLDEAQAIKNRRTKRARAAVQLHGKFRIATTGTPIENHLSELWSLFQFLNPGLLGSYDSFNNRFAIPIEREQDRQARQILKRLVGPFILRRLKNEILEELPPKTEIELTVELSDGERAFYEALRREAVERLESGADQDARFAVLAEITRLRRACCNPHLVDSEIALPSSKLALFLELVDELIENRHRALVFSQFVGHLDLLREALDAKEISYCYLDGSTPLKQRRRQVESFQAGEAELFLISLKAGGTGLNLTAADYVIHMDPWWNPAVEDQASDRAHRIGQTRPVTIYRLITESTIEEKIVKLHQTKRDLAESLLEGTDQTGTLDVDELLELLKDV